MKTIICLLSTILVSISAIAHENPDRIGKCFVVDGKNSTKGCIVASGGGAGGMYTLLTIGEKEYLIEESTMNPDSEERSISMGVALMNYWKQKSITVIRRLRESLKNIKKVPGFVINN